MSLESAARGFEILERSVRLQAKLIDYLLDVSRIVAGKLRIEKCKVDLSAVVDVAVDAARPSARARDVTLTAAIAPGLIIDADSQRFQQVVSNLLTNALKFTPAHGSVHVDVGRLGASAEITVKDTGIGIARELLPRIFDRFQQGDATTTRTHSGLGLGLAIVKHLVEQQGGRIEAASAGRGCGASFTVTMPLVADDLTAVHPIRPVSSSPDPSLLAGVRVLVVDDEADARTTLAIMLQRFGAEPTVVASVDAACDAISKNRPDILLSDVAMPDQDGYVLIRRIRSTVDPRHMPAAALSARVDGDSKAQALNAGYQVYLEKPIEPAELAGTLAALVHRAHTV
jgi:CheY-like chemotaxis protein